jgi:ATP/ADP translocase
VRDRHPHPSQQPLLPLTMLVSLVVGLICLRVDGKYSALCAVFAFAWFLVAFALHAYAWILRDNSEWLDSRRDQSS